MYSTYHRICPSRAEFQEFRLSLCSRIVCRRESTLDSLENLFRSLVPNQASHVCHELEDCLRRRGKMFIIIVLHWAAERGRILLTHDVSTMTAFAYDRVRSGQRMPGIFETARRKS